MSNCGAVKMCRCSCFVSLFWHFKMRGLLLGFSLHGRPFGRNFSPFPLAKEAEKQLTRQRGVKKIDVRRSASEIVPPQ
jgi:hypothetical protein